MSDEDRIVRAVIARSTPEQRISPDAQINGVGERVKLVPAAGPAVEIGTMIAASVEEGDVIVTVQLDDSEVGRRVFKDMQGDVLDLAFSSTSTAVHDDGHTERIAVTDLKPSAS